jgi:hypothetical protein
MTVPKFSVVALRSNPTPRNVEKEQKYLSRRLGILYERE